MKELGSAGNPAKRRLVLAVLDIAGFARATQETGSADLFLALDRFYELVAGRVEAAGGLVVKFMGDAAFCCFPEKAAEDAVEALRAVKAEVDGSLAEWGIGDYVFVRAHLGEVACGPMGPESEKRFDLIGPAVNELFLMKGGPFLLSPDLLELMGN